MFYLCVWIIYALKYDFIYWYLMVFNSRKIFKAYYGFQVLYVFTFPSADHGPIGSGRDKVGIRAMVSLLILELSFYVFIYYCGIRLSSIGLITIASSILRCVYFIVVFWCYLVCLLWMRSRARDAPAVEAVDKVEQSF